MPSTKSRKKTRKSNVWQRGFSDVIKIILSPLIILGDSFRRKGMVDYSWVFAFFLFFTFGMAMFLLGFLITEIPVENTLNMLSNVIENREILSGDVDPVIRAINKYAIESKIDPNLIIAIIKSESNFNPKAVSDAGAKGLMQIMPAVWRQYSGSSCTGIHSEQVVCSDNCIFNPEASIRVGVKYFKELLTRYHGRPDLALEAYNAGLMNVKPGQEPKYAETRGYVRKTLKFWQELRKNTLAFQLQSSLNLRQYLKWMLGVVFLLWIIFFWWANRKLFSE